MFSAGASSAARSLKRCLRDQCHFFSLFHVIAVSLPRGAYLLPPLVKRNPDPTERRASGLVGLVRNLHIHRIHLVGVYRNREHTEFGYSQWLPFGEYHTLILVSTLARLRSSVVDHSTVLRILLKDSLKYS